MNLFKEILEKLLLMLEDYSQDISMFKLNKPSFSFYADKISFRDLEEADIIFTRKDKLVLSLIRNMKLFLNMVIIVLLKIK